jgi:protein-tyrosine phosphatase
MRLDQHKFEILFVCHANICRSPLAERLARHAFDKAFGMVAQEITVHSAGTHAMNGGAMHQGSSQVLDERGVDSADFASRRLNPPMVADAALVLTADRAQRAACASMAPSAVRRVFTLRQFARIAEVVPAPDPRIAATPSERFSDLLEQVILMRSRLQPVPEHEDALADPVRQPIDAFRTCADEIERTLGVVVRAAGGN